MIFMALGTAFFLAWSLGRNNLSNLFGPAIGTRMLPFQSSVLFAAVFVVLGAICSGTATTQSVSDLGNVSTATQALAICLSAGLILIGLSHLGIPASITQTTTGAYVGWNLFYQYTLPFDLLIQTISAWMYTPLIAGILAYLCFKLLQKLLKKHPIKLLLRDKIIRYGLLTVGIFSSYALGANNVGSIIGPFMHLETKSPEMLFLSAGLAIAVGFCFADKKVIKTVSSGMFPLTPSEAFIVVFISALTLFLFSSVELKNILLKLSLPTIPLVPVPLSGVSIGAIIGIAVAKGITGLKLKSAGKVICSWITAPVCAGVICYGILSLFMLGGIK